MKISAEKKEKLMLQQQNIVAQLISTMNKNQIHLFTKYQKNSESLNKIITMEIVETVLKSKK